MFTNRDLNGHRISMRPRGQGRNNPINQLCDDEGVPRTTLEPKQLAFSMRWTGRVCIGKKLLSLVMDSKDFLDHRPYSVKYEGTCSPLFHGECWSFHSGANQKLACTITFPCSPRGISWFFPRMELLRLFIGRTDWLGNLDLIK